MKTNVVILAQGRQERMGDSIAIPKQLVPLPACGSAPILGRTLAQLSIGRFVGSGDLVSVVSWHETHKPLYAWWQATFLTKNQKNDIPDLALEMTSLLDPGNSSLKGIHRYLEMIALTAGAERHERTVVLLGDVIYSWECLRRIFDHEWAPKTFDNGMPRCRFVGTSDISPSGGELWGVMWHRTSDTHPGMGRRGVIDALQAAVDNHPPFQAYQPGQLRRWMWQIHPSFHTTTMYERVNDYTMDIDLPEHLALVDDVSKLAADDDRTHGVMW